jgi:adenylate kinase family enzyme
MNDSTFTDIPAEELEQEQAGKEIEAKATSQMVMQSAADLLAREFPEPKWAVKGLLSEGATVIAGAPKAGKSYFALGLAIAIASGGYALGSMPVEQGDVLYAALEDGERRMQKRLREMLQSGAAPERLTYTFDCPRIDEGGLEAIEEWLIEHPDARLVIVDTLKRIRPQEHRIKRIYDNDYDAVAPLNDLAQKHRMAILIVHHTNKLTGNEDWFDSISGSLGLSAAVDNLMLLRRPRNEQKGTLYIGGRDIDDKALEVQFDGTINGWRLIGNALSPLAQKLLGWIAEANDAGLSKSDINRKNGGRPEGVRDALAELSERGFARSKPIQTAGKPQERWYAITAFPSVDDNDDIDDESQALLADLTSSKTSTSSLPF